MQQGGGPPAQSQYGVPSTDEITPSAAAALNMHMMLPAAAVTDQSQQQQLVEEASPISSRPPAPPGNLDEFMRLSGLMPDEDALDADRSGGGVASGNRWPRQETLALLQIRSEMDAAFRDASVKGPIWEDVSRKLEELGYKRSAKKCKEKFENVHKYYKRTKEGRCGRQDGKSYRFFTQLEALHNTTTTNVATVTTSAATTTPATLDVAPVSVGIPMSVSPGRIPASTTGMPSSSPIFPLNLTAVPAPSSLAAARVSFSSTSNSFTSSPSCEEDDDEDDEDKPSNTAAGGSRKRTRHSSSSKGGGIRTRRMMEFFEGLMKHVMQKQEAMQQRFLEAIEKREHERMIREEAWKRQEMARLSREHELMAQERAISASRDGTIVSFLQRVTGQTIQLPSSPTTIPAVPQPQPVQLAPVPVSIHQPLPTQPQSTAPQMQDKHQHQNQQHHQQHISSDVAIGVPPEQEIGGSSGSLEPSSSRWPKVEVLALIKLRSGLESRYHEAGPKGQLWEEISSGMQRMGYKRNAKRCKEKWENINKYFKKVKESNKKRPEDAKTCPYFHELDALYRKKIIGSNSGSGFANQSRSEEQQQQEEEIMKLDSLLIQPSNPCDHRNEVSAKMPAHLSQSPSKTGGDADKVGLPDSLFGEVNERAPNKPEGIVKEFIKLPGMKKEQHQQQQQQFVVHDYDKVNDNGNVYVEDEASDIEDDDNHDDDEQLEEERKTAYKIEFQRQNTSATNGGGKGALSFLAMVQ